MNPVFDMTMMFCAGMRWVQKEWHRVRDIGIAAHLVNSSNKKKDLTTLTLQYLGVDLAPYESKMRKAVVSARGYCSRNLPDWMIGLHPDSASMLPSGTGWKCDIWLLPVLADKLGHPKGECQVVNKYKSEFDVYIGRGSKWGNPFVIGQDGTREEVIEKYRQYILNQPELLRDLHELDGKVLGCFCKPKACHGDVLQELLTEIRHPWYSVGLDYALSDTAATLPLGKHLERIIKQRKLWKIYQNRNKLLKITQAMELKGVTVSGERTHDLNDTYSKESKTLGKRCVAIAKSVGSDLVMPKSGNNGQLVNTVFGKEHFGLTPVEYSSKTREPSLNKDVITALLEDLPLKSPASRFLQCLSDKRSRDTASGTYITGYIRHWIPAPGYPPPDPATGAGWYVLHPSINPVGTSTLRWSSSDPNQQNVAKKTGFNLRYCFGPAPGRVWYSMDFKNLELRLPAWESGEEELISLFERPDDPPYYGSEHLLNFSTVYPDIWDREAKIVGLDKVGPHVKKKYADTWYGWCKNGDFAVGYGAIERTDIIGTADKAFHREGSHARLKERFAKKESLNQFWIDYANTHGYVETMPDKTVDPNRGYPIVCPRNEWGTIKPTIPLNYRVQSTAMHLTMMGMIRCYKYLDNLNQELYGASTLEILSTPRLRDDPTVGYFLVMQVHDEVAFDFPAEIDNRTRRRNERVVKDLARLLESGGDGIGVPTPVSVERHSESWDKGETIAL